MITRASYGTATWRMFLKKPVRLREELSVPNHGVLAKKIIIMNDAVSQDSEGGGVSMQGDKTEK